MSLPTCDILFVPVGVYKSINSHISTGSFFTKVENIRIKHICSTNYLVTLIHSTMLGAENDGKTREAAFLCLGSS